MRSEKQSKEVSPHIRQVPSSSQPRHKSPTVAHLVSSSVCVLKQIYFVTLINSVYKLSTFHNVGDARQGSLVILGVFPKRKLLPRIPAQVEYDRVSVPVVPHVGGGHILNKGSRTVVNA